MRKINGLNNILLIDDDMSTNYFNEMVIQLLDIDVKIDMVLNGMDALKYLLEINPDESDRAGMIFLDLNMPQLNAWDFLSQYNAFPEKIKRKFKIIMLSSSNHDDDMDFAMNHIDILGYLHKPLAEEQLRNLLHEHYDF
jgi:CheY-like chemotaxis protein